MDAALETKLRAIADRDDIWQVLLRFARGLDRMDRDMVRSCYFDDAIEDHGRYIGMAEGFIDWVQHVSRLYEWTQHSLTNFHCDLQGDDAYAETYYLFVGVSAEPPHFLSSGRYIDHFQRRNGEWRIANRVTLTEGVYDLPETSMVTSMGPAYLPDEVYPGTRDRGDISYRRPPVPRMPRG